MKTNFWDKIASHYDNNVNKTYKTANESIINLTKTFCKEDDIILDIGCGTGLLTTELANSVKSIDALDNSKKMIALAKEKSEDMLIKNIQWTVSDFTTLANHDKTYNIITAFNLLLYVDALESTLENIHNLIEPNGYFISATDCQANNTTLYHKVQCLMSKIGLLPKFHQFTPENLTSIIAKSGFEIEYTQNVHTEPPNYLIIAKKITL